MVYAKQANISNGPQQVNNGLPAQATHAEKIANQPNELLEATNGERLDTGTTQETIGINTARRPWDKAIASQNSYKGGWRQRLRELATLLREQNEELKGIK